MGCKLGSASEVVDKLSGLSAQLASRSGSVYAEIERITGEWHGLKRVGGGRDDHAAQLLKHVRGDAAELHAWLGRVVAELDAAIADPWGDD